MRDLAGGDFITQQRNVVLVGGTGTGKTHLAIAIAGSCVRAGSRGRFFTTVDLVNRLEAEGRGGRQGRLADYLTRLDFVILDELGYLPFAQASGQLLFEATGAYHRLFQRPLVEAGLPWVKVNPCQARRFAQATTGKLAKTDRCDALMLARMGAVLDLETRPPASKTVEALRELVNARDALIKDRVPALNRQAIAVSPLIKRQLAQRLRQINGQVEAIDKHLNTAQRRLGPVPAVRHLDEHSRHRRGDRKRARRRDA